MEIVIAIVGSGALSALIAGIFSMLSARQARKNNLADKNKAIKEALKLIMYDRIKHLGRSHIADGYITAEDLEDLIAMHQCYHDDLGGNGYLDSIMQAVRQLPIKG